MKLTAEEERKIIPELPDWNSGNGISLDDWAECVITHEQMIAATRVLWPDFVAHDDCVFCANGFTTENYWAWMKSTGNDKTAVETVMNHCHVVELFINEPRGPNREQVVYLGRMIASMWAAKLRADFPDRAFDVTFPVEDFDDLIDYQVTFFQRRQERPPT